ncbi:hypothetical protein COU89_03715 [Candidatus Roizmanbacteria bacterium CG10_big_fil_rev_8_21_14_0_10_45_7]|uniref:Uncharacterized protein n=1 Tax=Candidatus Roizmanbacteria bacterium CG10_big_fil_rev_8_21_14_0_10_45_7 TaxID=1974854 RepID=A0A2M8KTW6_9BACT|nr:MAG: hypothetical protein COU89_03715 [Candidatus Roizmanbacteria bacterium CG10_big_fil_rev_8_21_14_0_10_45_7]
MTKKITKLMATVRPHLVITYDLSGLYGHPTIFSVLKLPTHMARDPSFDPYSLGIFLRGAVITAAAQVF